MSKRKKKASKAPTAVVVARGAERTDPRLQALRDTLTRHREAARAILETETKELLEDGVELREMLWVLQREDESSPVGASVIQASTAVAEWRTSIPDLAVQVKPASESCPAGYVTCMYIGPEPGAIGAGVLFDFVQVMTVHDANGWRLTWGEQKQT